MVSNADPAAVQNIIDMLEELIAANENTVSDILQRVDDTAQALNAASAQVVADEDALGSAQGDESRAELALSEAETAEASAETAKTEAQGVYDGEIDTLNNEQQVLREVIAMLESLMPVPEEEILYERHSCGEQVKNLGEFQSAHDCALVVAGDAECTQNLFMWSSAYPVWGCRCCESADSPKEHDLWNLYQIPTSGCEDDPFGYVENIEGTCADAVNMGICNEDVSEYFTLFDEPILANDPRLCPLSCGAC